MEIPRGKLKRPSIGKIKYFAIVFLALLLLLSYAPFLKKGHSIHIPIQFLKSGKPCIEIEIGKDTFLVELDSGSDSYLSIKKELLNSITKTEIGNKKTIDIKGNYYDSPLYSIDSVKVGGKICMNKVPVFEESMDFLLTGSLLKPSLNNEREKDIDLISGRVGNGFLKVCDYWLLDFPHSQLVAIRDLEAVKKRGTFSFEGFTEVSLIETAPLIVISAETGLGTKTFPLDTGASRSIIRTPTEFKDATDHVLKTDQFILGGRDFGPMKFYLFEATSLLKVDGLLGRDFFQKHAIYLDFKQNRVYIGPAVAEY